MTEIQTPVVVPPVWDSVPADLAARHTLAALLFRRRQF